MYDKEKENFKKRLGKRDPALILAEDWDKLGHLFSSTRVLHNFREDGFTLLLLFYHYLEQEGRSVEDFVSSTFLNQPNHTDVNNIYFSLFWLLFYHKGEVTPSTIKRTPVLVLIYKYVYYCICLEMTNF